MKYQEIEKRMSGVVAEKMAEGWTLTAGRGSWSGIESQFFLEKDGEHMAVYIASEGFYEQVLHIRTAPAERGSLGFGFEWTREENAETLATFYEVSDGWYEEDKAEAEFCRALQQERFDARCMPPFRELGEPTDALMELLRRRTGWKRAAKKNVRVRRFKGGYEVCLLDKDGAYVKKTADVRF